MDGISADNVISNSGDTPQAVSILPRDGFMTATRLKTIIQAAETDSTSPDNNTSVFQTQLDQAGSGLRSLYGGVCDLLCPAGTSLILVPMEHIPAHQVGEVKGLTLGNCAMIDLGGNVIDVSSELIIHKACCSEHNPATLAQAFGIMSPP
eukprot:TRINITY_DN147932_c0_g1_i1.p2 TRINITY_DN147932_c0_g1~~TRINITY_DN147932_c0_g1_i1.p2  ORF type:complete len:150 (+),score=0.83 TRINITY_DN147932_c0_g1_i1:947-1396(+)